MTIENFDEDFELEAFVDEDIADLGTARFYHDELQALSWNDAQTMNTAAVDFDRMATALDRLGSISSPIAREAIVMIEELRQTHGPKDGALDRALQDIAGCVHVMSTALANPAGLVLQALQHMEFDQQQQMVVLLEQAITSYKQ